MISGASSLRSTLSGWARPPRAGVDKACRLDVGCRLSTKSKDSSRPWRAVALPWSADVPPNDSLPRFLRPGLGRRRWAWCLGAPDSSENVNSSPPHTWESKSKAPPGPPPSMVPRSPWPRSSPSSVSDAEPEQAGGNVPARARALRSGSGEVGTFSNTSLKALGRLATPSATSRSPIWRRNTLAFFSRGAASSSSTAFAGPGAALLSSSPAGNPSLSSSTSVSSSSDTRGPAAIWESASEDGPAGDAEAACCLSCSSMNAPGRQMIARLQCRLSLMGTKM
mmetsp:Transcript_22647/g.73252  ORF Transcript_22647/g.73252 Transcript_22647/m.73252 type:complete len:280 (+) Transcript_22647:1121-1960(+)